MVPALWQPSLTLPAVELMVPALWQPVITRSLLGTFMPKFELNFGVAASSALLGLPCKLVACFTVVLEFGPLWMEWSAATPWFVPFPSSSTRDKPPAPSSPTPAPIHQGAMSAQLTGLG